MPTNASPRHYTSMIVGLLIAGLIVASIAAQTSTRAQDAPETTATPAATEDGLPVLDAEELDADEAFDETQIVAEIALAGNVFGYVIAVETTGETNGEDAPPFAIVLERAAFISVPVNRPVNIAFQAADGYRVRVGKTNDEGGFQRRFDGDGYSAINGGFGDFASIAVLTPRRAGSVAFVVPVEITTPDDEQVALALSLDVTAYVTFFALTSAPNSAPTVGAESPATGQNGAASGGANSSTGASTPAPNLTPTPNYTFVPTSPPGPTSPP